MERWELRAFNDNFEIIIKDLKKDKDTKEIVSMLSGEKEIDNSNCGIAVKIYKSILQRSIVEALLIAEDCDIEEASSLTGVSEDVLKIYNKVLFRCDTAFISKIDKIDFIESGVTLYAENDDDIMLNLFLLLRWTISLGKEFVIWKFRLLPTEYAPDRLYNVVMKEAFFYHKEKSMGNSNITLNEYLRSTNTLLGSVKTSTSIKGESEEDSGFDILDQLGIIVEEKEAPSLTLDEISCAEFINNATKQDTT